MRFLPCVLGLLLGSLHPFLAQRDAAAVLKEMRQALGGAAALDGLKTFSASGSRTLTSPHGSRRVGLEWLAIVPDHFLEIRRNSSVGPLSMEYISYEGLAGSRPIHKTEVRGGPAAPETQYADNSPAAVAARERVWLMRRAQAYTRILLVLTGTSTSTYPLQFSYVGVEDAEGKKYDVIDATGPDGFSCRLHVEAATHLPAMLTWLEELPSFYTTSSVVTTTTTTVVRVPSGSPIVPPVAPPLIPAPAPPPSGPPAPRGPGPKRWLFKSFKTQDGITWPRVIEEEFDNQKDEIRLGQVKINPKIDARKFDIK